MDSCFNSFAADPSRIGANQVNKQEEYRRFAATCLELANRATELTNKASLLAMAEAWLNLADRISRLPADAPLVR